METRLKERLVGAIVLVAIVVIVVPELLTGPRSDAPAVSSQGAATAPVRTVIIDLDSGQRSSTTPERTVAAPSPAAPVAVVEPAGGAATRPGSSTADAGGPAAARGAPDPASPRVTAPLTGSSPGEPAAAAARSAGIPTPTPTPSTAVARAAVPTPAPAPTLAPAQAVAATPQSRDSASPAQDASPPRPKPSGAASGWVVQLGSFASRPNAEKLAGELRSRGYAAFVSEFRGSGRVLYRVRVGPEQDRARADALAARLAREGRNGTVAPHP